MKYIRTKEHIYKRLFIDRAIINECGYGSCDKELNPIGETIIKESDNLEELCDGWVLESKAYTSGFFVIYNTKDNNQIMKNVKPFEYEKLFAFIKTDKGELELL